MIKIFLKIVIVFLFFSLFSNAYSIDTLGFIMGFRNSDYTCEELDLDNSSTLFVTGFCGSDEIVEKLSYHVELLYAGNGAKNSKGNTKISCFEANLGPKYRISKDLPFSVLAGISTSYYVYAFENNAGIEFNPDTFTYNGFIGLEVESSFLNVLISYSKNIDNNFTISGFPDTKVEDSMFSVKFVINFNRT